MNKKIDSKICKRTMINTILRNVNLMDFLYRLLNEEYKDKKRKNYGQN